MKIKVIEQELWDYRVTKTFTLLLPNGRKLLVQKWQIESNYPNLDSEHDGDYEILDGEDAEAWDSLTEEEQDEVREFINELSLLRE